mmetsp:Transcript_37269/g.93947  ORF Transcript_37269/g.93947 Transcript_37269/m.93947 type:complete len:223 (-) Transcript_37269:1932-2600(-)
MCDTKPTRCNRTCGDHYSSISGQGSSKSSASHRISTESSGSQASRRSDILAATLLHTLRNSAQKVTHVNPILSHSTVDTEISQRSHIGGMMELGQISKTPAALGFTTWVQLLCRGVPGCRKHMRTLRVTELPEQSVATSLMRQHANSRTTPVSLKHRPPAAVHSQSTVKGGLAVKVAMSHVSHVAVTVSLREHLSEKQAPNLFWISEGERQKPGLTTPPCSW